MEIMTEESNIIFSDWQSFMWGPHYQVPKDNRSIEFKNLSHKKKWFCILPQNYIDGEYEKEYKYIDGEYEKEYKPNLEKKISFDLADLDLFKSTSHTIYTFFPKSKLTLHQTINILGEKIEKSLDHAKMNFFNKMYIWNEEPMTIFDFVRPDKVQKINYVLDICYCKLLPIHTITSNWKKIASYQHCYIKMEND